jgi:hypothetical protein
MQSRLRLAITLSISWLGCGTDQCPKSTQEIDGYCVDAPSGALEDMQDAGYRASPLPARTLPTEDEPSSSESEADDGQGCTREADCASGHCDNGLCCESGDCCRNKYDCPREYAVEPTCMTPNACQGQRGDALCDEHVCRTNIVDDDSACSATTVAVDCGGGEAAVYCSGALEQRAPNGCDPIEPASDAGTAADSQSVTIGTAGMSGAPDEPRCSDDQACGPNMHCVAGECVDDLPNGERCSRAAMCGSGYCGNQICCTFGQCCQSNDDCRFSRRQCVDRSACRGTRIDQQCSNNVCRDSAPVEDDEVCSGMTARTCGDYREVTCGTGVAAEACPTSCASDDDCSAGRTCASPICVKRCTRNEECDSARNEICTSGLCADI